MAAITAERPTAVFHLVRFVGGIEVPYTPYVSDCSGCCTPAPTEVVETKRSCCGH